MKGAQDASSVCRTSRSWTWPVRARSMLTTFALLAVAGLLRFDDLGIPNFMIFDEVYYAPDACRYVTEGQFLCGVGEITFAHPPVAKWLIAAGIWAFGPTAFGSRIMVALFGTLSIGVLFLLARKVLRTWVGAAVAGGLLAIDFLHLVTSRVAVLEIFASFFVLLALLVFVYDLEWRSRGAAESASRSTASGYWDRDVHWTWFRCSGRWLTGAALGLAIGAKWTMGPVLIGVIAMAAMDARCRANAEHWSRQRLLSDCRDIFLTLLIIPLLVYAMTFVGRIEGSFFTFPWRDDSWLAAFVDRQIGMIEYHLELRRSLVGSLGPAYESSPWSWPLIQRGIPYSFAIRDGNYYEILAIGNPLAWWPGVIATLFVLLRRRGSSQGRVLRRILWVGLAGTYLYWLALLPFGLTNVFIYYFVATVPFLYLGIGGVVDEVIKRAFGKVFVVGYLGCVVAAFLFFYPVLTWKPLSHDDWSRRMLFTACEERVPDDSVIVAGTRFSPLKREVVEAYPKTLPRRRSPLPLHTRGGWCWL